MLDQTGKELRTLPGLWRWYETAPRQLAFRARTQEEAGVWQDTLRALLGELLGGFPAERSDLAPQRIEQVQEAGFVRELVVFQSLPGDFVPCYVLIPDQVIPPYSAVIALHGHGSGGARHLVGITANAAEREHVDAHNYDYARQLARRGYLVFAPVQRGFAERMEDPPLRETDNPMWQSSCRAVAFNALLCGKTLLGLRVWDVMRLIDYIETRPEAIHKAIGCVGLSGGGTVTFYTAALDRRISAAVISGAFNTFRDSIMPVIHCACNYIPNILKYAEMADIAGLIAPRPLLIENGTEDPIFPVDATRRALDELERIYAVLGARENLGADIFVGGHRWHGTKAYPWLAQVLGKPQFQNQEG